MPLDIVTVPCRSDNYAYLVKGPDGVCIIDAPDAAPIIAAAEARGWKGHLFDGPRGWADRLVAEGLLTAEQAK